MSSSPATSPPERSSGAGLVALGGAAFVYVTAEGLPVGLLGPMASGLHTSTSTIGLLVTVYAGVAGLAAVPVTALLDRWDRRRVMVGAVALLAVSQTAMAVAPEYALVMGSRVVAALAHGVFWSMLAPVAARLAPGGRSGRATARVFVGNSLALVVGIPLSTALGQAVGWRGAMAVMGGAAVASAAALRATLPPLAAPQRHQDVRAVPGLLRTPALAAVCAITLVVVIGHFTAYTFITSLVARDAGIRGLSLSATLLLYGAAGVVSTVAVGRVVDHRPRAAAIGCAGLLAASLLCLGVAGPGSVPVTVGSVACWGAAFTIVPVCLQSAVMRVAPAAADTASALYVVAFQVGIGGGALAGSLLVAGGQLASLPGIAGACAVVGAAIVVRARRAFPPGAVADGAPAPADDLVRSP